jgi:hypothetical protein
MLDKNSPHYVQELNDKLNASHRYLSEEFILRMSKVNPEISNVVNALNKECFGVWSYESEFSPLYTLAYINGAPDLNGEALDLNLEDQDKFDVTMAFCAHLAREYKHLDTLDVFNTYSNRLRSYLEMFDFRTVSNEELLFGDKNVTIIAKAKGIYYVPFIDKVKFYREFFGNVYSQPKPNEENVVYLLLDTKTGHIKIGRSKNVSHREATLLAQSPVIEAIAFWKAPKEAESHLHKTFAAKRLRGEWFDLSFSDMHNLKKIIEDY